MRARLRRDDAFLLVIDVQSKLAPHVDGHERIIGRCGALMKAARKLEIPVVLTEHCPEQIGSTVPALRDLASPQEVLRKTHFAATDEPRILPVLEKMRRRQAVVAGMEAHVCVMQSVLGLAERGFYPFLVADAAGSRRSEDRAAAIERVRAAGCGVSTAEMTLFEWMGRADIAEFRDLLAVVKRLQP